MPTGSFADTWKQLYDERLTEEQALEYEGKLTRLVSIALEDEQQEIRAPP